MNKAISTPIAIIIIVVCALLVGGLVIWQYLGMPKGEEISEDEIAELEELLNPGYPPPEEMRICEVDSDCVMAGLVGRGPDYGCYACKCIDKRYENKFRECGGKWKCLSISTYCKCINNRCESEIQERGI